MKRLFLIGVLTLCFFACAACNKSYGTVNYTYDKAIISMGDYYKEVPIEKWSDYGSDCYRLELPDGSIIIISVKNCILVKTNDSKDSSVLEGSYIREV